MKLAIISHTEHYKAPNGTIVGWGPTVSEINHLLDVFDTIYHVAMLYDVEPPPSALPYVSDKIIFVPLPALGGKKITDKFRLIWKSPTVLKTINKTINKVDFFQFRAPTGIGVYVIPFLGLCVKTPGWFKYAGNWNQKNPPLGYAMQRLLLKHQSRKVTINGRWPKQPRHCITFENPCLTQDELAEGAVLATKKNMDGLLTFCYVGRLEKPKGVERIIQALTGLTNTDKQLIDKVHLVGDGPDMNYFKDIAQKSGINFVFHGFLPRQQVFEIYKKSHFFLMPTTASEGFPKAIAEAMNYGCLPVVSNISSIGQYIRDMETGICINDISVFGLKTVINSVLHLETNLFQSILQNQRPIVKKFCFNHYNNRIKTELIYKE